MNTTPTIPGLPAAVSRETTEPQVRGTPADRSRSRRVDGKMQRGWSEHDKAILVARWTAGHDVVAIAAELNSSPKACRVMATRLQAKRPPGFRAANFRSAT